jgi:hypothetical protein
MRMLTLFFFLLSVMAHAQQNNLAHVSIWLPKPGYESHFENGYKQHLKFHAANKDKKEWYGWYVISGDRTGHFIDATFGHTWNNFDHSIDAAGDDADNILHTEPFAKFIKGYKLALVPELSTADSTALKANFLRIVTIVTDDMETAKSVFEKLKVKYASNRQIPGYLVYKIADGGNLNEWQILIGHPNFNSFAAYENLRDSLGAIERSMKVRTIQFVSIETLRYRKDMSLFANER